MKKNPGRKERRRLKREHKRELSKQLQHMHIVEQRKAVIAKRREVKVNENEA